MAPLATRCMYFNRKRSEEKTTKNEDLEIAV
jgi:hypothetical protein